MNVIKRSGEEVQFNEQNIINAITGANESVEKKNRLSKEAVLEVASNVVAKCKKRRRAMNVEEIQDLVEKELMAFGNFAVAKNYITYRYTRQLARKFNTTDEKILSLLDSSNEEVNQENSNKNPTVNSVKRDYMT